MPIERPPLSVAQGNHLIAHPVQNSRHELFGGAPFPPRSKTASAAGVDKWVAKKKLPPPKSAAGLLLTDSLLNPVWFNAEAIQILSYPDKLTNPKRPDVLLSGKIRSNLIRQDSSGESPFVTEFWSGRRHYFCRAFFMDLTAKDRVHPSIAVLLERGLSTLTSLPIVFQQFNLTRREQETLEYLVQGLSNKEISDRMNISSNTVKAFLRLIMTKMRVSSRSAIVAKILAIRQQ
jgi:DNA-binding CsgD family transcriptional regulator